MAIDYCDYCPLFKKIARFVITIRARGRCEHCGVRNNSVGHWKRTRKGEPPKWMPEYGSAEADDIGAGYATYGRAREYASMYNQLIAQPDGYPHLRVVKLACAHLDHDITHNELENLAALCQACHRHHDSRDNAERRMYGPTGQHRNQPRLFPDSKYAPLPDVPKPVKEPRKKRKYARRTNPQPVPAPIIGHCESGTEQSAQLDE